ncbi:hypothetical protein VE03_10374 [Pseudogymnoascus sp. 23342-1-I1]|nr:hypothetical protein VE03_10374 [Pseudogymnoascus sp. 23342-1-I1]
MAVLCIDWPLLEQIKKGLVVNGVQFRCGDITSEECFEMVKKDFAGLYDLITLVWVVSTITVGAWVERGNSMQEGDTGEARPVPGSTPLPSLPPEMLPRYSVTDQKSYDTCAKELRELAGAAGLRVMGIRRYYKRYEDRSSKVAGAALEEWWKMPKGMQEGMVKRDFLVGYREGVLRDDLEKCSYCS